jgi:hypothetical protein
MRVLRKTAVLLLVGALLAVCAPSASAAGSAAPRPGSNRSSHDEVVIVNHLGSLLASLWNKLGCSIDPLGHCIASAPKSDTGCGIDPFGRCVTSTTESDNGCSIDPWGHCATSTSENEVGCQIDPLGSCVPGR